MFGFISNNPAQDLAEARRQRDKAWSDYLTHDEEVRRLEREQSRAFDARMRPYKEIQQP